MVEEKKIADAIERILADLETCTQAVETMRPIVSDGTLLKKFARTYSAHVVTSLQDILCRYAILSLCRMWDKDNDTQSIPSLGSSLAGLNVSTTASRQRIDQILREIEEKLASARLGRLRNWRDKNLGHALVKSRQEKKIGGVIADPLWDDVFVVRWWTAVVVEAITAATDRAIDHDENRRIHAKYANTFWESFIDQPK